MDPGETIDQGKGTLRIELVEHGEEARVRISGSREELLGVADMVAWLVDEGLDCHTSVAPFGAGSAWFGVTHEDRDGEWVPVGNVVGGGIYIHCQPCPDDLVVVPGGRGFAWMCFRGAFEEIPEEERDFDPMELFVEGGEEELAAVAALIRRGAEVGSAVGGPEWLAEVFGDPSGVRVEVMRLDVRYP